MDWFTQFLTPEVGIAFLVFWFVSNLVSAMPRPDALTQVGVGAGKVLFYKMFFDFLHLCVGNAPKVFPSLRVLDKPKNGDSDANKTQFGSTGSSGSGS